MNDLPAETANRRGPPQLVPLDKQLELVVDLDSLGPRANSNKPREHLKQKCLKRKWNPQSFIEKWVRGGCS